MTRTVPVHALRPNETDWTPPVVITFDTETATRAEAGDEVHTLRCWSARLAVRRDRRASVQRDDTDTGLIAADLAALIDQWSARHPSLWIYAHNLSFDLTVSQVTGHLADLGWAVTEFAIDSASPFVKMSNGRRHLTFADSFSWLPDKLETIAALMGEVKPELPAQDDDQALWLRRCQADADILMAAMREVMDWWDAQQLGRWSVTGSAAGWNAMRHKADVRRIIINPSKEGIDCDRSAVYGGRRGVARSGALPAGRYAELDFTAAYPTIARDIPLPCERMSRFTSLPVDHPWITSSRHGIIARVLIETDTPRWPVRVDGRTWYPVGRFWTHLAGPDIAEAARLGCLRQVGAGHLHRLGYVMRPWAEWILSAARGDDPHMPAIARLWAKHCGRAVIGKWAQRSFVTTEIGPSPVAGWHADEAWHHTAGVRATIIDFDGRRWQATASEDGDNCYPAVLAWVESATRVRLGRVIDSAPAGVVVSFDTDGMIADLEAMGEWTPDEADIWPLVMRRKNTYRSVRVIGPQHLRLDGDRRYAGVPKSATQQADGTLEARLWPKMAWQMGNGQPGAYVRPSAVYKVASTYAPGWVLEDGTVVPVEAAVSGEDGAMIVNWWDGRYAARWERLADEQNKALARYRRAHG